VHSRRHVQVNLRRRDFLMPEQILDGPQIRPGFQQVRREGVPQRMTRHVLLDPREVEKLPVEKLPVPLRRSLP